MRYEQILRDVAGLVGIVLMSAAGYMIHPVAGLGTLGATLFGLSVVGTLRARKP